jgi:hypothetical protein
MDPLPMVLAFLSWPSESQLRCFPHLAADSGSRDFSFDRDNPIVKLARIVDDLHFAREGEPPEMRRNRLGIKRNLKPEKDKNIAEILEGLHVVFYLMRSASVDNLFTKHGVKGAATWRFIRNLARDGKQCFERVDEPLPESVREFVENYRFNE